MSQDLFNGALTYVMNFRLGHYKANDYLDAYKNHTFKAIIYYGNVVSLNKYCYKSCYCKLRCQFGCFCHIFVYSVLKSFTSLLIDVVKIYTGTE